MKKLKLNLDDLHVESFKVTPDKPGAGKGTVEGYSYECTFDDTCRPRLCPTEFNCPTQHTACNQNTCDPWCTEHTHCGQYTCAAGCTVFTNCGTCGITCDCETFPIRICEDITIP